jgi:hypothetical protein
VRQGDSPSAPPATAMHVFIDAMQLLVDSPIRIVLNGVQARWLEPALDDNSEQNCVRGQHLNEARRLSVREYAKIVLRRFCAARFYSTLSTDGFTTMRDIERWVRCVEVSTQ